MSQDLSPYELLEVAKTGSVKDLLTCLENDTFRKPCDSKTQRMLLKASCLQHTKVRSLHRLQTCESRTAFVDVTNDKGETALSLAVAQGHEVAIQTLICAEADVNQTDGKKQTLLMLAVKAGRNPSSLTELRRRSTADSNLVEQGGRTSLTLKVADRQENCVQLLLQAGADPNAQDNSGRTALMVAAGAGSVKCVQLLLKAGANLGMVNNKGKTALMIAVSCGSYSCVGVLVKEPNCHKDAMCDRGKTALFYAVEGINNRCTHLVLRYGARHAEYLTQLSVFCDCAKLLIESGADVNIRDKDGKTALMHGSTSDNMVDLLHVMLQSDSVDVNVQDRLGMTAVMHAVRSGSPQCLQCLVNSGASVNTASFTHRTPLHFLYPDKNDLDLVCEDKCLKILLNRGASVNATDIDGVTPLMHLSKRVFIEGASSAQMQVSRKSSIQDFLALLLCHGANVNLVDKEGRSALLYASQSDNPHTGFDNVAFFLQNGADPNVNPSLGESAFDYAIHAGCLHLLKLLVRHGVELEVDWEKFQAILHSNKIELLQLLIMSGVMPTSENYNCFPSALITTGSKLHVIKYFIVNCYLQNGDLSFIFHNSIFPVYDASSRDIISPPPLKQLMVELGSQPWPLVKLCFVTVSTLLGASPGRRERIKKSQLPKRLQDMLMFNDPLLRLSSLCPHYWDKIPLTLDPEEYERLPRPRPLLYHWPVGRPLVTCDCGHCGGTMYKFEEDDSDSGDDEHSD